MAVVDRPGAAAPPAASSARGADEALAELYQRHFQAIYDFVLRTVRDADTAADVVQNTFIKAWETLRQGEPPENVKAWLFTVARNAAIDEMRRRSHIAPPREAADGGGAPMYLQVDPDRLSDPEVVSHDRELVELVWQAARSLNPRDYSLLDLHLRQGLTPDELAESLGARRGSVYMMLSRLKEALEDAVTCLMLARRGRRECPSLDALLAGLQVRDLTKQARRAIRKHLDSCQHCRERSRQFIAPAEIFSSFAVVPVTPELRASIWQRISDQLAVQPAQPPARGRQSARASGLQAAASACAALALLGAMLATGSSPLPAHDPPDVHSPSHQTGVLSVRREVQVEWSPQQDLRAYGLLWSQQPGDEPAATERLPGGAGGTSSPALRDGTWYFHLRSEAASGMWTDTVHLGPFLIGGSQNAAAQVSPESNVPEPTPTATVQPTTPPLTATPPAETPVPAAVAAPHAEAPLPPSASSAASPAATTAAASPPPAVSPSATAGAIQAPTAPPAATATAAPPPPTPSPTATPPPTTSPTATRSPTATSTSCVATLAACGGRTPVPPPRISFRP
jgi:RNA polymerase sigma factor (sigma-70 family)